MTRTAELYWKSTFQPDAAPEDRAALRSAFLDARARTGLDTLRNCDRLLKALQQPGVGDALLDSLSRDAEASALVFDDPVFAIWLRFLHRAVAKGENQEILQHVQALPAVLADVETRLTGQAEVYAPGTKVAIQQADLNDYVKRATPPSYDFETHKAPAEDAPIIGHPIGLQADLVGAALDRIGATWPELRDQVSECVRIIGYLPAATFRSCSAARYSGVVYLGNLDESVLDIEESLVHETGHQVLYRLGEIVRLTKPDTPIEAAYTLPWSGSRRDLFGFLHAFYIYGLLVKYYWRRAKLGGHEAENCQRRAGLILLGCLMAAPMLRADANLTDQGRTILEELTTDLERLKTEMQAALAA